MQQRLRRQLILSHGKYGVNIKCDVNRRTAITSVWKSLIFAVCAASVRARLRTVPYGVESRSLGIITPLHVIAAALFLDRLTLGCGAPYR